MKRSNNTRLLATDQQQSTLRFGATVREFTPFGFGLHSGVAFNGEWLDQVTGRYLLGNGYRAFSTLLMRFVCPDSWSPFGEGGLNAYGYCIADPVNRSDPTGHVKWGKVFRLGRSSRSGSQTNLLSPVPGSIVNLPEPPRVAGTVVATPPTLSNPSPVSTPVQTTVPPLLPRQPDVYQVLETTKLKVILGDGTSYITETTVTRTAGAGTTKFKDGILIGISPVKNTASQLNQGYGSVISSARMNPVKKSKDIRYFVSPALGVGGSVTTVRH